MTIARQIEIKIEIETETDRRQQSHNIAWMDGHEILNTSEYTN